MSRYFELVPASGRDYKTSKAVKQAWDQGLDFLGDISLGFKRVNHDDIPKPCTVMLRYDKHRKFVSVIEP